MKRDCARVEEAIWDAARNGAEPPAGARRHAESCESCSLALKEAQRVGKLLLAADCVPAAPDCRSAVMARISGAKARSRVWSYAWAASAVAAVIIAVILLAARSPVPPKPLIVRKEAPAPKVNIRVAVTPPREQVASAQEPAKRSIRAKAEPGRRSVRRAAPAYLQLPRQPVKLAAVPPAPRREAAEEPVNVAPEAPPPVAFVSVSFEPPAKDDSYGYVKYDHDTGVTTTCMVKRSGNSIEVQMESTPGKSNSIRGGMNNETNNPA